MNADIPEVESARCPTCGRNDPIEASGRPAEATCPDCGRSLWPSAEMTAAEVTTAEATARRTSSRLLVEHADAILRQVPRQRHFGLVATVVDQFHRVRESWPRREPRDESDSGSGVYDHWLDG
jgi:hypothetical protein